MYPKGGEMLHTIRQLVADDAKWREMLRGLNRTFRHQTVTGAEVQAWMSAQAGMDLSKVFAQYLTTIQVPALEYRVTGDRLAYRWADVVPGFDMPVDVAAGDGPWIRIRPTEAWQALPMPGVTPATFRVNPDFYVIARPAPEP
jgi:aminopeptidase N